MASDANTTSAPAEHAAVPTADETALARLESKHDHATGADDGATSEPLDGTLKETAPGDAEKKVGFDDNVKDEPAAGAKAAAAQDDKPQRSKGKIALIMFALCMAVFLAAIDVTIITTALPTIAGHFHSPEGYVWIGSAFLLGSSASTPSWGKVSDIFGRKPVLLLANFIFFVGSLVAGLSINIGMLITARAIQGIGAGGLVTLVNICISDLFSLRNRGAFFGIIGGVWAVASSLGPIIGGAFTEKVTWRWCFYINLPLDGLAFIIILFFLDLETPKTPLWEGLKAIDWTGSALVVGGTLMFLFGLQYGGVSHPWKSAEVICLLVFGIVLLVLFVIHEWKFAKYPVMPLRLFNYRSNCAALGVCFIHGFVFIAGSYYLPLYFQAIRGANPLLSGVYLLPTSIALSIASISTGIFIKTTGRYRPPIWVGLFLMTLGYGLFCNFDASSSWAKIILYQIIAGAGIGPNFQAPLIALQTLVNPRDIATATATFGFIRQLATSSSVVIGQVVFQNQMLKHRAQLEAALPPQAAAALGGGSAGASVGIVDALPPAQRELVREAFADSLAKMWILYTAMAGVGLLVSFLIGKQVLKREHTETKTGLAAQEEARLEREEEKRVKRESKQKQRMSQDGAGIHEKSAAPTTLDKDIEKGVHSSGEATPEETAAPTQ